MKAAYSFFLSAIVVMLLMLSAEGQSCSGPSYTVKSGDTLSNIANAQGTTTQAIQAANPSITDPNKIYVGQVLCIPGSGQSCSPTSYTVKSGDTLSNIANAQGTTTSAIQAANPSITDPNKIYVGQVISIPCKGSGSGSSPTTPTGGGASLYSGSGSATYYYDLRTSCPQDASGYAENDGYPSCTSNTPGPNQQTLRQIGSNNVVAIDTNLLRGNRAGLCGKAVTVTKNGQKVSAPDGGDFFVWDGCQACVGGGKIDFSVSGARNVDPNACQLGNIPGVSYVVTDKQVKNFVA